MYEALTYDELNKMVKESKSMPYDEYFGEMKLTESEKERRISLAERFENYFKYVLILLFTMLQYGEPQWDVIQLEFEDGYKKAIDGYIDTDEDIFLYISLFALSTTEATKNHLNDPYYLSEDRAILISENESNSSLNYAQYKEAVLTGMKNKQWLSMKDRHVRESHAKVDDLTKKINEPFIVGDSLMQFPKDTSLGASMKEISGCRCAIKYF